MQSSTIVLAVGLLALPLALVGNPQVAPEAGGLLQLAQYSTGAPEQSINGRPLQDAPVPDSIPDESPADRVAGAGSRSLSAGPINATPFSAGPVSDRAGGSPGSANADPGGLATPNLGR